MSGAQLNGQPIQTLDELWKNQGWEKVEPVFEENCGEGMRWKCSVEASGFGLKGEGEGVNKREARIRASASLLEKLGVTIEVKKKDEGKTRKGLERREKELDMREAVMERTEKDFQHCLGWYLTETTQLEHMKRRLNEREKSLRKREEKIEEAEKKMEEAEKKRKVAEKNVKRKRQDS